jgi:hypothetical protein
MQKGFFASLFDVSFSSLVTTRIIRGLYTLLLVVISIGAAGVLLGVLAGDGSAAEKLAAVILVPVGWLLYVVWSRVVLEVVITLFRIMENTREIADASRPAPPAQTTAGEPAGGLI